MPYQGYIKLYRKIREKKWWRKQRERFTWGQAFIDLLLRVNHKDTEIVVNYQNCKVPKGSFITSQRKLAKDWHWGIARVNAYLNWLKGEEKSIDFKAGPSFTHIFFKNWDKYQGQRWEKLETNSNSTQEHLKEKLRNTERNTPFKENPKQAEHPAEHPKSGKRNTSGTQAETNNNVKECKEYIYRGNFSPILNNLTKNEYKALESIAEYFIETVKKERGFSPGLDERNLESVLIGVRNGYSLEELKKIIDFFLKQEKSKKFPTLSAALSVHTLNLWAQEKENLNNSDLYA